jgi:hypothetical protein
MRNDRSIIEQHTFWRRLILWLSFIAALFVAYHTLRDSAMGVKDMLAKLQQQKQNVIGAVNDGAHGQGSGSDNSAGERMGKQPPPIPHSTRPRPTDSASTPSGRPFVTVRNGMLELEDGTPFRFAALNAPELLDNHEFEVEDTMRTLAGFGRRVTRTYTLKTQGTSPHFGGPGHFQGWDSAKGDWIYHEPSFQKVRRLRLHSRLGLAVY